MTPTFTIPITVRMFDCDAQGHLAAANYLNYANQALWSRMRVAGLDVSLLLEQGLGPVILETRVRYLKEFRADDKIDVSCEIGFGEGKTYTVSSLFLNNDAEAGAVVESTCGLLDLSSRKLCARPADEWRLRATSPKMLGL